MEGLVKGIAEERDDSNTPTLQERALFKSHESTLL